MDVAPGQPVELRCPDERVVVSVAAGVIAEETALRCTQIDPGSVQRPPNPPVGNTVFRLEAEGDTDALLPGLATVAVQYPAGGIPPNERAQLVLGYLDGAQWVVVNAQTPEPAANRVTATVDRAGVYALYRRP